MSSAIDNDIHSVSTNIEKNLKSSKKKYRNLEDFLRRHMYNKENPSQKITNTRIGNDKLKIFGGSYYIPDDEYDIFLELYVKNTFINKQAEHLTEKQLDKGAILCDLDFRFESSVTERIHTDNDIFVICDEYLEILKSIYHFDDTTSFPVFVFQKPNVNIQPGKQTKDGLHIIIGIMANRQVQQYIRAKMIEQLPDIIDLPIVNTWEDVFDECITSGRNNWQLVGSCKPENETYKLTHHMTVTYDTTDRQMKMFNEDVSSFNMLKDIGLLSARHTKHYDPFIRNEIISEIAKMGSNDNSKQNKIQKRASNSSGGKSINIMDVKTREELAEIYEAFLETISPIEDYKIHEIIQYTMILPASYYEKGSYKKWCEVGWALHNTSEKLFIVWVVFSAQAADFDFSSISENMWDKWNRCEDKQLGYKSIFYWAKQHAPAEKLNKVKEESLNYHIEQTLNSANNTNATKPAGCTDFDIASVLYQMYKYLFVCVSVKAGEWYAFENNRWVKNDSGTSLRNAISTTLRRIYMKKSMEMTELRDSMAEDDERRTMLNRKIEKASNIITKLGTTNDKKNIMTEAKELFYDRNFYKNTDTNPYLLCFNNGVWDLKEGVFRDGRPEDYITKSTNIDYVNIDPVKHANVLREIADFMHKLFPEPDLEKYMWDHLASILIGDSTNQTFHNYIGVGENGKSVLVTLLELVIMVLLRLVDQVVLLQFMEVTQQLLLQVIQ